MAARISDRDRDALREFMPDLLRELFGITDLSRSFRCPMPDHDDSDPSAHYYANGNTVHCFGCDKTLDVFTLVGVMFGVASFPDQARKVAEIVGYRLEDVPDAPKTTVEARIVRPPREPFDFPKPAGAQDCSEACGWAFAALYEDGNEAGRQYLRSRGLDDDDAARYGLGFTRAPKKIMPQFRVYEPEALGFITIPFWSADFSEARYCMVRTISNGAVRNKEWRPKGVTSPLYNEHLLTAGLDVVCVTEGLIDAMAANKMSGRKTVALGGVANAKRLAQVLYHADPASRPEKVIVCMDADEEGRKAAKRICADLNRIGIANAALPGYPDGMKDPDEVLMSGRGKSWDFERWKVDLNGRALYRTRWRDDG